MVPKALFCWVPIVLIALATYGTSVSTTHLEPGEQLGTPGTSRVPETFTVRLETTKGAIVIECVRA
jgi:hypothetical protein